MINQQVYHGLWYVPDGVPRFETTPLMGTLTIEKDGSAKLDIYNIQIKQTTFKAYFNYKVIWGDTADRFQVTLFDAELIQDFNKPELFFNCYKINRVILGTHIKTGDELFYESC